MTGFGAASEALPGHRCTVRVEIRSVNHRYLQTKLRIPPEFAALEPQIEEVLRQHVRRGVVSATVSVSRPTGAGEPVLDFEVARRYQALLARLSKDLSLDPPDSLSTLLSLPGVVGSETDPRQVEREGKLVLRAARAATQELVRMRSDEGEALAADLRKHTAAIERVVKKIAKRMPTVVRTHQRNLKQRVEELMGDPGKLQASDLAREIALLAERLDVHEEVSRLESHLGQLEKLLAAGGEVGRRLDFLVQEFLREANTIGSKCNDAPVAHAVVELKTHIDRLREQVQNVE